MTDYYYNNESRRIEIYSMCREIIRKRGKLGDIYLKIYTQLYVAKSHLHTHFLCMPV